MPIHDYTVLKGNGEPQNLGVFVGHVLLVVNVASRCGFTPQYAGLQKLYERFHDRGFSVLAFPCNQFGGQEPGLADEIQEFCQTNYNVSFPVYAKIDVNGGKADPLYKWMKSRKGGLLTSAIKWNFTKFLIDRGGSVIHRYAPTTTPEAIAVDIEAALMR
ncbi:MAG: glutathione peroxidase [Acetobacteraceae bacterium]|nr:glutathione peroxidase [Acetobacteraceae bacterium]